MKKFLSILLILIVFILNANSQEVLQQYQTFNWSKVEKASKYGVEVEKHDADGKWTSVISEKTMETNLEVLLYPGNYRVSIATYNVLGKKASSTDWVEFTILDESEPYIFDDSFASSSGWNVPVIHLSISGDDFSYGKDNSIAAVEDYIDNSFLLKGKNFFFPETRFFFKPKSRSVNGMSGEPFVENRSLVELSIIRRDREKDGIYLSYDPQELFTGYYDFVIENPGNNLVSKEVLVITERKPEIKKDSLQMNKRYGAANLTLLRSEGSVFSVTGFGFDSNTKFTFVPTDEGYAYPFASSIERSEVIFTNVSKAGAGNTGDVTVTFNFSSQEMQTGYYNLTAANKDGRSCTQKFLVTITEPEELPKALISEVDAKTKKDVTKFTIKGENFGSDLKLTLVSPVNEDNGTNKKIPLSITEVKKNGKRIDAECSSSELGAGTYAVLAETKSSTSICYFEITEKLNVSIARVEENSVEELFMRPEEKEVQIAGISENEMPESTVVTAARNNGSLTSWVTLTAETQYIPDEAFAYCTSIGTLLLPNDIYKIGKYAFKGWTEEQTIVFNWAPSDFLRHYVQDESFMGCHAKVIYSDGTPYKKPNEDVPVQDFSYVSNSYLTEREDAEDWTILYPNSTGILRIKSNAAWDYNASWRKKNNFTKVIIEEDVKYICDEAFRNCTNLKEVEIASTVKKIGNYAFSGCTSLVRVVMPHVNTVSPDSTKILSVIDESIGVFSGCVNLSEIKYVNTTEGTLPPQKKEFVAETIDGQSTANIYKTTNALLSPYLGVRFTMSDLSKKNPSIGGDVYWDVINFRDIIALSATFRGPFSEDFIGDDNSIAYTRNTMFAAGGKISLGIPGRLLHPYVSAGVQFPFDIAKMNIENDVTGLPSKYFPFEAGFMLGGVLDISYNLTLNQIDPSEAFAEGKQFFTDSVSIGVRLPLRSKKYIGKVVKQCYIDLKDLDTFKLAYNSENSSYQYEQSIRDIFGNLPAKKTNVNIEWYAICNRSVRRVKVKMYEKDVEKGTYVDLSPKTELYIEDIKAGVPFNVELEMFITKKCKENAVIVFTCEAEDAEGVPVFKTLERK